MGRFLRSVGYAGRRGLGVVSRAPFTSIAIIVAIAASLISIGVLRLASHNLEGAASRAVEGPALVVYLDAEVAMPRAEAIAAALSTLEGTAGISIVSAEQARARLELELAGDAATLADLDATFFPITVEVALRPGVRQAAALHPFVERLQAIEGVGSVDVLGDAVDRAAILVGSIRAAGHMLSVFFTACAVFVVVVLIRSSSSSSSDRQLYMRLGASAAFAAAPDWIAGMTRGLAGGVLAVVVLFAFYTVAGPAASEALRASLEARDLRFLPVADVLALPIGGLVLGAIGAALAERGSSRA